MRISIGFEKRKYKNGKSVFDIYSINHYGSELIPPRPALTMAVEQIAVEQKARTEAAVRNLANSRPQDRAKVKANYMHTMGKMIVRRARDIIEAGNVLQHNAPRTVAQKGFDKPLFEEGLMEKSIAYEVEA